MVPVLAQGVLPTIAAPPSTHLLLNLPAYRLDVIVANRVVRTYSVSVGMRKYPTPTGSYSITEITWNPWWIPPPSDWAKKEKPTPPGPDNPMGKAKLLFSPYYYLHGTPFPNSVGRAASHGCVRLSNNDISDLASLLQSDTHALSSTGPEIARSNATARVVLPDPIPLDVVYQLIEVRDSVLFVHQDIYRLRTEPLGQMILAELISRDLSPDSAAVRRFAASGGPWPKQVLVRALLR